ncbi:MAG: FAD-dependent oxidoreductase [Flavobacteriia bacterium]|nr:FAD-dependent oxidoreductase [Flavobacteriia bacterium]OIP45732.1 MAG: oxidoreductase [Flavobacteriaceae bacterium CG2_30_31_66]PIV97169.1 MAG: oxidoreductase [Flavobacteriaceae bacterium CG17_big_fil_post_rev_8_21_14_2_50_31_13]PIX13638.1 MAG: oxidoreductase [Flavobacteriaceae bacterium CG_4_8_14_3_um_filter_31_8]PIY14888.1 MAG: oxidoreductase [Flavobacteriaceae bacterium CG_4_10_14_3_um_filter_31_253]PIZ09615.1 MAG: oxidoreductase [Flavobacteriaceae bacterium CG_4_10_14_0_8_um_filter_31_9
MNKSDYKIHIIGAGISGLIAAKVLEKNGYQPIILEAADSVGGRVKSDYFDGFTLDHGFQVLLTSYPAAKKYLDFKELDLQELLPGATIFQQGTSQTIGDPLRKISFLFSTIFSSVGSVKDKIKILKLNAILKKKDLATIFKTPEKTTLHYLQEFGFSDKMITTFFKPFFSGIFLEPNLETSSRMFEFVYKMFGNGLAVIPKKGMQEIPNQLKNSLQKTTIQFNTSVKEVKNNAIILNDGTEITTNFTIIATEASSLISNLKNQEIEWKSCDTLYFQCGKRVLKSPIIGLIADKNALVNNIFYHISVDIFGENTNELLSVTIVKSHDLDDQNLIKTVQKELKEFCGIQDAKFLKRYQIKKALPKISNLQYELSETETQLNSSVFLAGDLLLNGSLNAAMIAGEKAALGVIKTLQDGLIVEELTSEYN